MKKVVKTSALCSLKNLGSLVPCTGQFFPRKTAFSISICSVKKSSLKQLCEKLCEPSNCSQLFFLLLVIVELIETRDPMDPILDTESLNVPNE